MNGIKVTLNKRSNWLKDSGYTIEQQAKLYNDLLEDVSLNPRWYLDKLTYLPEFRVSWVNYKRQRTTIPYEFVTKKQNIYK